MIRVTSSFKRFFFDSGFTQMEFSELLEINQSQLSKFLNEKACPSINEIDKMCKNLECKVEDIIEFVEDKKNRRR